MIGFIKGVIEEIEPDALLIDRGGIGFRIYVPSTALDGGARVGDSVKLFTHLNVKEDALTLYGFFRKDELEVFRLLIGVSGVGPKAAMGILSTLPADELRFAVLSGDAAHIAKAPGVGKKTAQKIILELKDRFDLEEAFEQKLAHGNEGTPAGKKDRSAVQEAIDALTALGYSGTEALQAVNRIKNPDGMDVEEILKAALREMI
jgi:Holliday junction DNA helicase RuvA